MYFTIFLLILGSVMAQSEMTDNFPDIQGNLTKVTWAHAVNNNSLLTQTLSSDVMMIEADIVMGKLIDDSSGNLIPIMGHPPADTSDLSFEKFLSKIHDSNKNSKKPKMVKGVKLDFKSTDAFLKSIEILKPIYNEAKYPIWLNADILQGPVNAKAASVNAKEFLAGSQSFPNSVLSIGWTTNFNNSKNNSYEKMHIDAMLNVITENHIKHMITFPVRAGLAAESLTEMKDLISRVNHSTLTIWSSKGDPVNVDHLRELIFDVGVDKTYIDVPKELMDELHLDSASSRINSVLPTIFFSLFSVLSIKKLF